MIEHIGRMSEGAIGKMGAQVARIPMRDAKRIKAIIERMAAQFEPLTEEETAP